MPDAWYGMVKGDMSYTYHRHAHAHTHTHTHTRTHSQHTHTHTHTLHFRENIANFPTTTTTHHARKDGSIHKRNGSEVGGVGLTMRLDASLAAGSLHQAHSDREMSATGRTPVGWRHGQQSAKVA
jgi:hypothetical protein